MELKIEYVDINQIRTYANNAKIHTAEQVEQIKRSIEEFGMNDPIAVWENGEIIEGHGRLIACQELGFDKVPVIHLDQLTDEQRRAYMLVHNKLTMNTDFDGFSLEQELRELSEMDMSFYGFEMSSDPFFEKAEEPEEAPEPSQYDPAEPERVTTVVCTCECDADLQRLATFLNKFGIYYEISDKDAYESLKEALYGD